MVLTTSSNARARLVAATCAVFAAAALWTTIASADPPTPADLATARELYLQAKELRTGGDLKGALAKYQGAWATAPTPIIGVELGRTHMQLSQLIEAREIFLAVGRLSVEPDETKRSAQAREEAAQLAGELQPKISTLVVKVTGAPEGKAPVVSIDGANVAYVAEAATRKINPGKHDIVARVGTAQKQESVELSEGETKELVLDLASVSGESAAPVPGPAPGHPEGGEGGGLRPVLIYGGFGLAGVGVVVGGITGVLALGKASSVKNACTGTVCPERVHHDLDRGRSFATVSTIGFGAAVVGATAGLVGLFVLRPRSDAAPAVTPSAALFPGGGALGAEGRF